ncbi:MAG: ArgE/DapE family deacylase [Chloroflexi bacterium]|nr:ArgE/DapE family deacylase [Chloroflexota bacterium]
MDDEKKKVLTKVDELQDEILSALSELVRIPSISPNYPNVDKASVLGGEGRCNAALAAHYRKIGCDVDMVEVEAGRANAVGVLKGTGGGKSLIYNGHIDTVPPGDSADWKWQDPWSGKIGDGKIYGLGSCDMKGGIISQFAAAMAIARSGIRLKGDLILEGVVGEENQDHEAGTTATIKAGYRADAAVVSEPTSRVSRLVVAPASPGLLYFAVNVKGKATHPGIRYEFVRAGGLGSEAGVNAVEKGALMLAALQKLEEQWGFTKKHPSFPAGYFTIHPGTIIGGPPGPLVPFIVSTYCRIEGVIWFPPQEPAEAIKQELTDYLMKAAALDPWLEANPPEIEWLSYWAPYQVDSGHPICQTLMASHEQAAQGNPEFLSAPRLQGFAAVCDATFFNQAGIPAITYGPGNVLMAHRLNEHIPVDDLMTAAKAFALTAMEWCGVA